jgi:hypothetical protein
VQWQEILDNASQHNFHFVSPVDNIILQSAMSMHNMYKREQRWTADLHEVYERCSYPSDYEGLKDASSSRRSASPAIFLSCVTSNRSPLLTFSFSSSMALSWDPTSNLSNDPDERIRSSPSCSDSESSWPADPKKALHQA